MLSTSKNAAAVRVHRVVEGGLDLGRGRGRLPGERGPLLEVAAARPVGGHHGSTLATSAVWKYPSMAAGPATDVADLLVQAAAEDPDRLAIVESGGRRVTWGELDDEVGRLATGLGAAGIVAGHRVMIVLGNRIEFVSHLPRRAADPGGRRTGEPDLAVR